MMYANLGPFVFPVPQVAFGTNVGPTGSWREFFSQIACTHEKPPRLGGSS
jgi:hypothetical protein